ncbi:MAG: protease complex subunit PrcB family protein, partial [Clostridia bacterium]|nr:protease complex subunit PrcB family protein [Clostridia bacterium]
IDKRTDDKVSDIDYTIVTESEIPQTLMTSIEERKNAPFRLSYSDNEELYIAVGYGEQQSGGFGIVVDELYLTENTIT